MLDLSFYAAATLEAHPCLLYLVACSEDVNRSSDSVVGRVPLACGSSRAGGVSTSFGAWCRNPCLTARHSFTKLLAHSSVPVALQSAARAPEPSISTDWSTFEETQKQSLSTASAAQICISRDMMEIQLELHQVSALSPQLQARKDFLSFSFAGGNIKHQERTYSQTPGAAIAVSQF